MNHTIQIALAHHHADGTTTRHPQAVELFDEHIAPAFIEALTARLAGNHTPPAIASADCLHCHGENPTDLPVCPACVEKGIKPAYKFGRCLICEKKLHVAWAEALPLTCGNHGCVTRMAHISTRLGAV